MNSVYMLVFVSSSLFLLAPRKECSSLVNRLFS